MDRMPEILVIDDEEVVRDTLEALLGTSYTLHLARDGVEGIAKALEFLPDLILLDVMMPKLDGFEVCARLRADPATAEIPIIMITALDDRESRLRGLGAGVDDFLSKPFDGLELKTRCQSITRLNRYRRLVEQRGKIEKLLEALNESYGRTLEGWTKALDLRDKETEGHTRRVVELSLGFANAIGLGEEKLEHLRNGALLHDVGKLGVPDSILLKPGRLTDEEWITMRLHPVYAYEWLSPIGHLATAVEVPYGHHEKWDGSGYPRGLGGTEIDLLARMFALVDVWDALRSDRPYRKPMSERETIEHIRAGSGTHFDPDLAGAFISMQERDLSEYRSNHQE